MVDELEGCPFSTSEQGNRQSSEDPDYDLID